MLSDVIVLDDVTIQSDVTAEVANIAVNFKVRYNWFGGNEIYHLADQQLAAFSSLIEDNPSF